MNEFKLIRAVFIIHKLMSMLLSVLLVLFVVDSLDDWSFTKSRKGTY